MARDPGAAADSAPGIGRRLSPDARLWLAVIPGALLLLAFLLLPASLMLRSALGVDSARWAEIVTGNSADGATIARTLVISVQITLLAILLGYPYAWVMAHSRPSFRRVMLGAILLSFFTNLLVRSYAWTQLLGPAGPIAAVFRWVGFDPPPQLLYNRTGVLIGMTHILLPLLVLPLYAVIVRLPDNLARAARTLGANPVTAFLRVIWPLTAPGVAAGAVIVFIQSLGFFVTPALLGGRSDVMAAQAIDQKLVRLADIESAASIAVVLVVGVLVLAAAFRALYPLENLFLPAEHVPPTIRGGSRRSRVVAHDRMRKLRQDLFRRMSAILNVLPWGAIMAALAAALALFFIIPLLFVIPLSFTAEPFLRWPPGSYGTSWYANVFADVEWRSATANSLGIGALASLIALSCGVPVAFTIVRSHSGQLAKRWLLLAIALPAIIPIVVTSLGTFVAFLETGLVSNRLALAFSHAVLGLPFVVFALLGSLRNFNLRIEQAARSLGATQWTALRRVTLPILLPAIAAGGLFAFLISFDELLIARAVLRSAGVQTLPMKMWIGANEELSPALAVVSTLEICVTILVVALGLAFFWTRRRRTSMEVG